MKPRDLSLILKDAPPGEWIALSADQTKVMGHGETIEDAVVEAGKAGEHNPILVKMPLPNIGLVAAIRD